MKAYKVEVLVLDFENYGEEQIDLMLSKVRGLMCSVQKIQSADIGEWSDDNPLNYRTTTAAEYNRLFPTPTAAVSAAPSGEVEPVLWAALNVMGRVVYSHESRENVAMNAQYIKTPTKIVGLAAITATKE